MYSTGVFSLLLLVHTEEVKFIVAVNTADYCGQVIANVDVFGSLSVYGDANHSTEKHMWNQLLRALAHFKASFTSPSVSLFYAQLDTVTATVHSSSGGWVATETLYSTGVATSLGTTVEFMVPAPYQTDVYFEFDVPRLFSELAAPINSTMTVTAICTISFSGGQGRKRNVMEESSYLFSSSEKHLNAKRFSSNMRTLRTDTTLYFVGQQRPEQQQMSIVTGPIVGVDREGDNNKEDSKSELQGPSSLLVPFELLTQGAYFLGFVIALLIVVLLVLLIIKQARNLL